MYDLSDILNQTGNIKKEILIDSINSIDSIDLIGVNISISVYDVKDSNNNMSYGLNSKQSDKNVNKEGTNDHFIKNLNKNNIFTTKPNLKKKKEGREEELYENYNNLYNITKEIPMFNSSVVNVHKPSCNIPKSIENMFIHMSLKQKIQYFVDQNQRVYDIVRDQVYKGIPDQIRGFAWQILVDSYAYMVTDKQCVDNLCNGYNIINIGTISNHKNSNVNDINDIDEGSYNDKNERVKWYNHYLSINNKYERAIRKDINRTYPNHILFKNKYEKGQQILFNILKAYSNYNKDLGYCQGMAFIVATFILYMNETDAFFMLIALLDRFKLNDLFSYDMPLLNEYLFILDKLIFYFLPEVHKHLEKENVHSSMYASQWFLTLFSYNINIFYVTRIWDFLFIHNTNTFLFKIAIAFFKLQKEVLLKESFEEILNRLKVISKNVDLDVLIKTALELKIKKGLITKLSSQYKMQK
uniref:Rab-GAP TBC domain-containing protein n=1 Tax=Piliocolobus tephrosceles TaxID=591936 RepID=A0A8C9GWF4_9PRIM